MAMAKGTETACGTTILFCGDAGVLVPTMTQIKLRPDPHIRYPSEVEEEISRVMNR